MCAQIFSLLFQHCQYHNQFLIRQLTLIRNESVTIGALFHPLRQSAAGACGCSGTPGWVPGTVFPFQPGDDFGLDIIIIIITTTIFIVLSSTAPAICESSLRFLWSEIGQRQMAVNS